MCAFIRMVYPDGKAETPRDEAIIKAHFLHAHYVDVKPYLVAP